MRRPLATLVLLFAIAGCGASTTSQPPGAASPTAATPLTSEAASTSSTPSAMPGHVRALDPFNSWPGFGYDEANSLHVAAWADVRAAVDRGLTQAWAIRDIGAVTGTPAIDDGVAYFGDWRGILHAVDVSNGAELWATRRERARDIIAASPLVTESRVFIADLAGYVHAVDRRTGQAIWSVALEPDTPSAAIFSSPVLAGGLILIGTVSMSPGLPGFLGSIVALDAWTGSESWRIAVGSDDPARGTGIGVWSSAAVDPGRHMAFIGTGNTNRGSAADSLGNSLVAIDYQTGEIEWTYRFVADELDNDVDVGAGPNLFTVNGRAVVGVGCKCGDYAVVDRGTGELVWRTALTPGGPGGGVMTTAAVDGAGVYVHSYDFSGDPERAVVFMLDLRTGAIEWQRAFDEPDWSAPGMVLVNDVLFQGTAQALVALDATTGDVLWTDAPGGQIGGGIAYAKGYLLVGYNEGWDFSPPAGGGIVAYAIPRQ